MSLYSRLFINLTLGKLKLNPLWEKPSYRLKFALRSLFLSPKTFTWTKTLSQYRFIKPYLSQQTNLPCKLQRPYLSKVFNQADCLNALTYHYDLMDKQSESLVNAFYSNEHYLLAEISGKNDELLKITIKAEDRYSREGEMTLYLENSNNDVLATLTFSIIEYKQTPTLIIAGLQGPEKELDSPREAIQKATKACFGLFPKKILVEVALMLAEFFNLNQIIAVGNSTHIYNNWRYRKRLKELVANYDEFWETLDATQLDNQLFKLPNKIERKSLDEIASKKRFEYRQRYQLLDDLHQTMFSKLNALNN